MKEIIKKHFRSVLSLVLIAAMVLMFAGCGQKDVQENLEPSQNQQESTEKTFAVEVTEPDETKEEFSVKQESKEKTIAFEVTELDGTKKEFSVKYENESSVGEVLVGAGLISGSDSQYGLKVDTVNGQKYDYNKDGAYWAFYINGEYAMTGVDSTPIKDGEVYSFVATKA